MAEDIKDRVKKVGKTLTDFLPVLAKYGYKISLQRLSDCIYDRAGTGPAAKSIIAICYKTLEKWETEVKQCQEKRKAIETI